MQITGPPDHPNDRDLRTFGSCSLAQGGYESAQARTLVGVEEKTVCEDNKACKQIGLDFGDLMKK